MKTLIVGGTFGEQSKQSSVVNHLGKYLKADIKNGGTLNDLKTISLSGYKLIIWMPNVDNNVEKYYPIKDVGSTLIVSKLLKPEQTHMDALTRIFKIHGNAVITITATTIFNFKLLDALGNVWTETTDVELLTKAIYLFHSWSSTSLRTRSIRMSSNSLLQFIDINRKVADKFEEVKGRYFGNSSTRCSKMFPSMRSSDNILVSKRNVRKERITIDDMVLVNMNNGTINYFGAYKPSVDTPIHLSIYKEYPNINYMIHGHTYIKDAPMTNKYYPCGDLREFREINKFIRSNSKHVIINLRNHGFLICTDTILNMDDIVNDIIFIERQLGTEQIENYIGSKEDI